MRHAYDLESTYGPATDLSALRQSMPIAYEHLGSRRGRRAQRRAQRLSWRVAVLVWLHRRLARLLGGE